MAATNLPGTLPGTLPSANYQPTYRSTGACDDLAELVAPYSLSRAQLAEATGIADEATVNGWVEQCCPDLAADAPAPLEPVLRYLDETYLPDPANWPGTNPYDEFILENIAARMLAHVVADTFGADRSDSYRYRELLALIATLVLIARYWDAPEETFLTLLNAEPTAEAGEYLQEAIANAPESLYPLLTELLLPALREVRGTFTADEARLLAGYALAAGRYAGEHPHETLDGIHASLAEPDRALPDADLIRRVEDVLKANFSAARVGADASATEANPEPRNFVLPGNQDGYETAAHLIAVLPQAHDVIAFSTRSGERTGALAEDPRAAFTLYLCYLMLGDDESSEERAAELYRASRGE